MDHARGPGVTITTIGNVLLLLTLIPANLGPILYFFSGPWWRLEVGRALMIAWTSIGLLIDLSLAFTIWGEYPGRSIARLVVFALLSIGLWYKLIALLRIRRHLPAEDQ